MLRGAMAQTNYRGNSRGRGGGNGPSRRTIHAPSHSSSDSALVETADFAWRSRPEATARQHQAQHFEWRGNALLPNPKNAFPPSFVGSATAGARNDERGGTGPAAYQNQNRGTGRSRGSGRRSWGARQNVDADGIRPQPQNGSMPPPPPPNSWSSVANDGPVRMPIQRSTSNIYTMTGMWQRGRPSFRVPASFASNNAPRAREGPVYVAINSRQCL